MNIKDKCLAWKSKEKIVMLTCYDYCTAKIMDNLVDFILVGDSLGMVVYGEKDTKSVTMEVIERHCKAVAKGVTNTHIIGDMPINTYNNKEDAIENAKRFIQAGAHSVKIEGCKEDVVKALITNEIPVLGHLGLLPQTADSFKVQGKTDKDAEKILEQAKTLEKAGVYAIVLECIPNNLAKKITESISIPTIGIGAGKDCDGQVLVIQDLLGMFTDFKPKFVKRYAQLGEETKKAIIEFNKDVKQGKFPTEEHSFKGYGK
jgi:3-methyl-2-oxobutanoate hydroxymethyltransferase